MKILISGTPGVGKSTLSRLLSSELNIEHVDLSEYIKQNNLYGSYNSHSVHTSLMSVLLERM